MSFFRYLAASLALLVFLSGALGSASNETNALEKKASPKIDPKATFTKLQIAQIEQGIKDACTLANAAYQFSKVRG